MESNQRNEKEQKSISPVRNGNNSAVNEKGKTYIFATHFKIVFQLFDLD